MTHTLLIRHISNDNAPDTFRVENHLGKATRPVELPSPDSVTVEGRPSSHLLNDLGWYLEQYLNYPFSPNDEVAARVCKALERWGESVFAALFNGLGRDWYQDARKAELTNLTIKVASDEPKILAWPWEALKDPQGATLAYNCNIERQLNELNDPIDLPDDLPQSRLNILLVIARPLEQDVGYHAISRPLVELAANQSSPIHVDVLRPPTFEQLRKVLEQKPGHYHIVHFDGHGGYGGHSTAGAHTLQNVSGKLLFENEQGGQFEVSADVLTDLLTQFNIPIMVLNACQSARIDENAENAFASVAASLIKAGIRSVVAMGYSLYVSGAKVFVPGFYEKLFETGDVTAAVRNGRSQMRLNPQRQCMVGEAPLQDWMVPVLYQQAPVQLTFNEAQATETAKTIELPKESALGDLGFIGRERAVLALERRTRIQPQGAILVHGMAGIGKTTLAKGYLHWLSQTNGLHYPPFWFQFDEIHNVEYLINQLMGALFDSNALAAPMAQKLPVLIDALKNHPLIMVWDNFESAAGIAGTEVNSLLSEDDRSLLATLLQGLRGGKTTVLITSRSNETWLPDNIVYRLPITGLKGEECWTYCNALVKDLGLSIAKGDDTFKQIINKLDGHPLALQAVLAGLKDTSPKAILDSLEKAFNGAQGDESIKRIYAALNVLIERFPPEFEPVLSLIGLHERFVVKNYVLHMLQSDETEQNVEALVSQVFNALQIGGLVHETQKSIYSLHPALSNFIAGHFTVDSDLEAAFVGFMARYADKIAPLKLHEQRGHFYLHRGNFYKALQLAEKLQHFAATAALVQVLAFFSQNNREYVTAKQLFAQLAEMAKQFKEQKGQAGAYHQLGRIAQEQRDFKAAEDWYQKALVIHEKLGDEHGAAITYHQLGIIAQEQRDFKAAENWYQKALEIIEKYGNEHGAAITYHHLGIIAQEQRDFNAAEKWYQKAIGVFEKQGNEHGAAGTYHQLGVIAQEQRDFKAAENWYQKSLEIKEKQGNEHGAAQTYHQLGMIAQAQRDFKAAESWYQKSLEIKEKQGDEYGAATTYHHLGVIAQEQRDFNAAEKWYQKSLEIEEKLGNEHGAALTRAQIGKSLILQEAFTTSASYLTLAINGLLKCNDQHYFSLALRFYFSLIEVVRENQPELEAEIIQHFNSNKAGSLPEWGEIEKQLEQARVHH